MGCGESLEDTYGDNDYAGQEDRYVAKCTEVHATRAGNACLWNG